MKANGHQLVEAIKASVEQLHGRRQDPIRHAAMRDRAADLGANTWRLQAADAKLLKAGPGWLAAGKAASAAALEVAGAPACSSLLQVRLRRRPPAHRRALEGRHYRQEACERSQRRRRQHCPEGPPAGGPAATAGPPK
eukprot:CAMPEP_0168400518 /NCGR_PEP_ID=MMETSP0228-20121227/22639_1 /TAXON_ID=133427 /ORGANISM="Protoceratium reticulatum, Strain CCCM 535 (=CCMP 1889)" /LENGTH=137 /DNA_ID=CAMNT_0008414061 /DNA_START=755 /DNA_END=1165 /DNA_ORIENTATION=-